MYVTIRTQNSQRRVTYDNVNELDNKIKEVFKTEEFSLFTDFEKTKPITTEDIKEKMTIFMAYEIGELKTHQPKFECTHSIDAVCPKCVNLEASDRAYTPGKKVKYFSYLSYLEALENKSMKKETFNYEIKKCEEHPANQRCSKCMDKQITLVTQPYRHIDYVEFDSKSPIETVISDFKFSNRQQIGLLLGKIYDNPDIPQGKKAVISAIWKVDQEKYPDGVVFNSLPQEFYSKELSILGVIYTDLVYKNKELTSTKKLGDYQISTIEIDLIAQLAIKYNNNGFLGVCISTNEDKEIEPQVFMVTEQYIGLSKVNAVGLTTDPTKFISYRDIVYFITNEYDKKVSQKADPLLPVFYFIVTCEIGFNEKPLFEKSITIKKRNAKNIAEYFSNDFSFEKFMSFDVLCTLKDFIPALFPDLLTAVIKKDKELFNKAIEKRDFFDFKEMLKKFSTESWNCSGCTFLNEAYKTQCDMCGCAKP